MHYLKKTPHHIPSKCNGHHAKNCKKITLLCDKCVNNKEDCVCSVNDGDQDWLNESESESENVRKSNNQATVGKSQTITTIRRGKLAQ